MPGRGASYFSMAWGFPVAVLALLAFCSPAAGDDASAEATACLKEAIRDPQRVEITLMALKATGDAELSGVFVALSRSGDKEHRLLAVIALRDFSGPQVAKALLERLKSDPAMAIRAEALLALIATKAITDQQLTDALKVPDDAVQSIAARELVARKQAGAAAETLSKLAESKDIGVAGVSRLCLLAVGDKGQLGPLGRIMGGAKTDEGVLAVLLEQIAEDKVASAAGLAERAAASDRPLAIRVIAYKAVAATSVTAAAILGDEIARTESLSLGVRLLSILAEREDASPQLMNLGKGDGAIAALSRFELARRAGGQAAAKAAKEAAALAHPVVIEYLLDRASTDVASRGEKAAFYVPALLQYVRSVKADALQMTTEHIRAAGAVILLADLGTPEAMQGLKAILSERYNCRVRAAAAGLVKTKNQAACELAQPLLKSPYEELYTDAALTLGRFGQAAAKEHLVAIIRRPDRHPQAMVAQASWYLLKIAGKANQAAEELAACVD